MVSEISAPEIGLSFSKKINEDFLTPIEKKTNKIAIEVLKKELPRSSRKKRRKIRRVIFGMGKIIIGILGAVAGGPILAPVAIGVGLHGAFEVGIQLTDIMDSGNPHDRIKDIDRGHRGADEGLKN